MQNRSINSTVSYDPATASTCARGPGFVVGSKEYSKVQTWHSTNRIGYVLQSQRLGASPYKTPIPPLTKAVILEYRTRSLDCLVAGTPARASRPGPQSPRPLLRYIWRRWMAAARVPPQRLSTAPVEFSCRAIGSLRSRRRLPPPRPVTGEIIMAIDSQQTGDRAIDSFGLFNLHMLAKRASRSPRSGGSP